MRAVILKDGRILAFGRSIEKTNPDDKLPMSISYDGGNSWEYSDSEFPVIAGGQRLILMRLWEGLILFIFFTGPGREGGNGMFFYDINGNKFRGYGMFGALSFDEGEIWPIKKLITPADGKTYEGIGTAGFFSATDTNAEPTGYLIATQTPDKIIHLFSSGLHYEFNLEWIKLPGLAVSNPEKMIELQQLYDKCIPSTNPVLLNLLADLNSRHAKESEIQQRRDVSGHRIVEGKRTIPG